MNMKIKETIPPPEELKNGAGLKWLLTLEQLKALAKLNRTARWGIYVDGVVRNADEIQETVGVALRIPRATMLVFADSVLGNPEHRITVYRWHQHDGKWLNEFWVG
jgi:hypothetical protein